MAIRQTATAFLTLLVATSSVATENATKVPHRPGKTAAEPQPGASETVRNPTSVPTPTVAEYVAVDWGQVLEARPATTTVPPPSTASQNKIRRKVVPSDPATGDGVATSSTKSALAAESRRLAAVRHLPEIPAPHRDLSKRHSTYSKQTAWPAFAEPELVPISFSSDMTNKSAGNDAPMKAAAPQQIELPRPESAESRDIRPAAAAPVAQAAPVRFVSVSLDGAESTVARNVPKVSFSPIQKTSTATHVATRAAATSQTPERVAFSVPPAGDTKPATAAVPSFVEVADVDWSLNPPLPALNAMPRNAVAFNATECPFLTMSGASSAHALPTRLQQVAQDAGHLFADAADGAPPTLAATSFERGAISVPADVFGELRQLLPKAPVAKADSSKTYLADLAQLLSGDSPWVLANDALMVDLAPQEPEPKQRPLAPAYMRDLQTLLPHGSGSFRASSISVPRQYEATAALVSQQRSYDDEGSQPGAAGGNRQPFTVPHEVIAAGEPGTKLIQGLFSPVSDVSVNGISTQAPETPAAKLPDDQAIAYAEVIYPYFYNTTPDFGPRRLSRNTYPFRHNPTYFEDPNLERCGQSHGCLTTLASAGRFYTTIAVTPYLTTLHHPHDCVRSLPDCPTCHAFSDEQLQAEWSWKAAAVQAGAITGLFYIIP